MTGRKMTPVVERLCTPNRARRLGAAHITLDVGEFPASS